MAKPTDRTRRLRNYVTDLKHEKEITAKASARDSAVHHKSATTAYDAELARYTGSGAKKSIQAGQ